MSACHVRMIETVKKIFQTHFQGEPLIVRSPGRINIIGEHTDYNDGFVLPAAIDKSVVVAISARPDDEIHLYADQFAESYMVRLADIAPGEPVWINYILGVVQQLRQRSLEVRGFHLALAGDVPAGAGLSSSAAVECAVIFAINRLFGFQLTPMEMVRMAQAAEHAFAGVFCGIMDMYASMFGREGYALQLDCRSLNHIDIRIDLHDYEWLLLNSNVFHRLASSAYNERRSQCAQGVAWVQAHVPDVRSLRDVDREMLRKWVLPRDPLIYQRCRFVIEENARVLSLCSALESGDGASVGRMLREGHQGLSEIYEVSCPEIDFLVETACAFPGVAGARMMGGGFGGCTLNLVRSAQVLPLIEAVGPAYRAATGLELTPISVRTAGGTSLCS